MEIYNLNQALSNRVKIITSAILGVGRQDLFTINRAVW